VPSVVVHTPLVFEQSRTVQRWIGDYVGFAFDAGKLYMAYGSDNAAESHVAFFRTNP